MRVLWFERSGASSRRPPPIRRCRSPASRRTTSPTLAGWWRGTDIAELLSLGLRSLARRPRRSRRGARKSETLIAALLAAGLIDAAPGRGRPARRRDRGGGPRLRRRRRLDCSPAPRSTISSAKRSRPTCPAPTASGRTGASGRRASRVRFRGASRPSHPGRPRGRTAVGARAAPRAAGRRRDAGATSSREITARSKSPRGRAGCRSPAC